MALKRLKYRVTATVTKDVIVEVDENNLEEGQDIEDLGQELANAEFNILNDDNQEKYTQEASFVEELPAMTYEFLLYENQNDFNYLKACKTSQGYESMKAAKKEARKLMKKGMVAKVQSDDREEIEIFNK